MSTHPSLREPHTRGTFPTRRSLTGPDGVLPQPRAQARPAAAVRTHLVVLIPAYQPDARLPQLVTTLRRDLPGVQVLVVDDGSGPTWAGVFDEARERGAQVISYPVNAGKGHALRTGLARALPSA